MNVLIERFFPLVTVVCVQTTTYGPGGGGGRGGGIGRTTHARRVNFCSALFSWSRVRCSNKGRLRLALHDECADDNSEECFFRKVFLPAFVQLPRRKVGMSCFLEWK
ncbi:hypothetical protein HNY73_009650 [Argiope bruennichi]|uniref:Secreted protein n=1 Tax=Argiope bruennichi TaxID=94029 RepID=A0A8T0FCN8_ARGBR|nr:hypothetical protein HNY73_009650 [Argiope bruennichi]